MVTTNGNQPSFDVSPTDRQQRPRTERQRETARQNGAKSQGPKTAKGKRQSALNSIKHGGFAEIPVLPGIESAHDWEAHRQGVLESLAPQNHLEVVLAERVASILWRLNRVDRYETRKISREIESLPQEMAQRRFARVDSNEPAHIEDIEDDVESTETQIDMMVQAGDQSIADETPAESDSIFYAVCALANHIHADFEDFAQVDDAYEDGSFEGMTIGSLREYVARAAEIDGEPVADFLKAVREALGYKLGQAKYRLQEARTQLAELTTDRMIFHAQRAKQLAEARAALERSLSRTLAELTRLRTML